MLWKIKNFNVCNKLNLLMTEARKFLKEGQVMHPMQIKKLGDHHRIQEEIPEHLMDLHLDQML